MLGQWGPMPYLFLQLWVLQRFPSLFTCFLYFPLVFTLLPHVFTQHFCYIVVLRFSATASFLITPHSSLFRQFSCISPFSITNTLGFAHFLPVFSHPFFLFTTNFFLFDHFFCISTFLFFFMTNPSFTVFSLHLSLVFFHFPMVFRPFTLRLIS